MSADDLDGLGESAFEEHLEQVLLTSQVAMVIHRVTHPGCHDFGHLTQLDTQRAKAAIQAMRDWNDSDRPGEHS